MRGPGTGERTILSGSPAAATADVDLKCVLYRPEVRTSSSDTTAPMLKLYFRRWHKGL
eukprot:SAG22_NODE_13062_length_420_cov_0.950156_2_plen_57_part_01